MPVGSRSRPWIVQPLDQSTHEFIAQYVGMSEFHSALQLPGGSKQPVFMCNLGEKNFLFRSRVREGLRFKLFHRARFGGPLEEVSTSNLRLNRTA